MDDNEFWIRFWVLAIVGTIIMTIIGAVYYTALEKNYAENGYCQTYHVKGTLKYAWQKCGAVK